MQDNIDYLNTVAPRGSNIYYSLLYATSFEREVVLAIRSFSYALTSIVSDCSDLTVAQAKLNWWRNALQELRTQEPSHPILQALKRFDNLPYPILDEIVQSVANDLATPLYVNLVDLTNYYEHTGGATEKLIAAVLGETDQKQIDAINALGVFIQGVANLRDIRLFFKRGRSYIAGEVLLAHQVTLKNLNDLSVSPAIRKIFSMQASYLNNYYQKIDVLFNNKKCLSTVILAKIYKALLDELVAADFPILHQRIDLTPLRKFWIAWRTKYKF